MRQTYSLLLLLAAFSLGQCHGSSFAVGDSCTELVSDPNRCGEPEEVVENVVSVDEPERFG